MARKQFKLPDVGEGLADGEILRWFVSVGDHVTVNQTLVEIETAKAAVELPSPYEGEVVELLAGAGDVVDVGVPIITIETEPGGATVPADAPVPTAAVAEAMGGATVTMSAEPATVPISAESATVPISAESAETAIEAGLIGGEAPGGRTAILVGYGPRTTSAKRRPRRSPHTGGAHQHVPAASPEAVLGGPLGSEDAIPVRMGGLEAGRLIEAREAPYAGESVPAHTIALEETGAKLSVLAKPPVRKMARDLGVDLRTVAPSGPGGTITRADVAAAAAQPVSTGPDDRVERIAVRGVRRMTAQAMVASAFTAPHVTEFLTVDLTRTVEFVERLRAHKAMTDLKVSPLLVVAKAMCLAARRTPEVNATFDAEAGEIVLKHFVNLGIAAATPRGLLVPNISGADDMSLPQLAAAIGELTATAREGRTQPADMTGGTITVTNVGVFGVDAGTPIINPGESAILAFGAIRAMPWVVDGQVVPRQVTTLSLSFDHRVVDGEAGSRFLVDVASVLEDPAAALLF